MVRSMVGAMLVGGMVLAVPVACRAAEPRDPAAEAAKFYDLTFEATPKLAKGAEGRVVVRITPKNGAELHKEAPISLSLKGAGVELTRAKAGRAELQMSGNNGAFEIPFKATTAGKGSVDADLSFYICTDEWCVRQAKTATLPVEIR